MWTNQQPKQNGKYWAWDGTQVREVQVRKDGGRFVAFDPTDPNTPIDLGQFTHFQGPVDTPDATMPTPPDDGAAAATGAIG